MRMQVQSLALLDGFRIWRCCELWCRPAATAPIRPLAWEPPYAAGAALTRQNKNKKTLKPREVGYLAQGVQLSCGRAMFQNQESIVRVHVLNRISANSVFLLSKYSGLPKKVLVIKRNVCLVTYTIIVGGKAEVKVVATWGRKCLYLPVIIKCCMCTS